MRNSTCGIQEARVSASASLLSNQVTTLNLHFLTWKTGLITYPRGLVCRSHKPKGIKHLIHLVTLWALSKW